MSLTASHPSISAARIFHESISTTACVSPLISTSILGASAAPSRLRKPTPSIAATSVPVASLGTRLIRTTGSTAAVLFPATLAASSILGSTFTGQTDAPNLFRDNNGYMNHDGWALTGAGIGLAVATLRKAGMVRPDWGLVFALLIMSPSGMTSAVLPDALWTMQGRGYGCST